MSDVISIFLTISEAAQRRDATAATHRPEIYQPSEDTLVSTFPPIPFLSQLRAQLSACEPSFLWLQSEHRELPPLISVLSFFLPHVYLRISIS